MKKERLYWMDNIRTVIILLLFLAHTCEMFHLKEGFYVEGAKSLVPTLIYNGLSIWAMSILFFLAGVSTMYSLRKRTIKEYYLERLKKLFLPFVAGIFLLVPIQAYWTMKSHYQFQGNVKEVYYHFFTTFTDGFYGYDGGFTPAHLWFLLYLMGITLVCYPVIRYMRNKNYMPKILGGGTKSLVMITVMLYIITYGTSDEAVGRFLLMYILGILFFNHKAFFKCTREKWKILVLMSFIIDGITAYLLILMKNLSAWSVDYMWMHLVRTVGCIVSLCAVIGLGQACLNNSNKIWSYFTKRSFQIYYWHMAVVIAVGYYILTYVKLGVMVQSGLIICISAVVTFLLVEVLRKMQLGFERIRFIKPLHRNKE